VPIDFVCIKLVLFISIQFILITGFFIIKAYFSFYKSQLFIVKISF